MQIVKTLSKWLGLYFVRSAFFWILDKLGIWPIVLAATVGLLPPLMSTFGKLTILQAALIGIAVIGGLIWLFLAIHYFWQTFWKYRDTPQNRQLVNFLLKLSRDMFETITDDDCRDPITQSNAKHDLKTSQHMTHTVKAKATYERKFSGRVEYARQILVPEGFIEDSELFGHATNSIVRKETASKIEAGARQFAKKCNIDLSELILM